MPAVDGMLEGAKQSLTGPGAAENVLGGVGSALGLVSDLEGVGPTGLGSEIGARVGGELASDVCGERCRVAGEFGAGTIGALGGGAVSAATGLGGLDVLDAAGAVGTALEGLDVTEQIAEWVPIRNGLLATAVTEGAAETFDDAGRAAGREVEEIEDATGEAVAQADSVNDVFRDRLGGAADPGEAAVEAGESATEESDRVLDALDTSGLDGADSADRGVESTH